VEHGISAVFTDDLDHKNVSREIRIWKTNRDILERNYTYRNWIDTPIKSFTSRAVVMLDATLLEFIECGIDNSYGLRIKRIAEMWHRIFRLFAERAEDTIQQFFFHTASFSCKNPIRDMAGKIDDPIDASFEAFPGEPNEWSGKLSELALTFTGVAFPPAAILKIFTDQFSNANRFKRIEYLLQGLRLGVKALESQVGSDREKMKEIQTRIEAPQFQESIATAFEESARATNLEKIGRFAQVLAGSLVPTRWSPEREDVATLIRDLAQLGDRDIEVLEKLALAFGGLMLTDSKMPSKLFTDNNAGLDRIVEKESDRDEFYSTCGRLIGFGLAIEEAWPMNHTAPHERCIRPTRRGLSLLGYLRKFAR
jgi:hypothetical protein